MASLSLKTLLTSVGAAACLLIPAGAHGAELNIQAAGPAVGKAVGQRWCSGEDPEKAIELSVEQYLSGQGINPQGLNEASVEALVQEITVESLAYAFQRCPERAKQVLRNLSK